MTGNDLSVESVEMALLSEIGTASAQQIKDAYLSPSRENGDERCVPYREPGTPDDRVTGPNARVLLTRVSRRMPENEIELILTAGRKKEKSTHNFYAIVLAMSMRLGDPSTTRFINGIFGVAFHPEVTILAFSPGDKGVIASIIETGGDSLTLSKNLELAPAAPGKKTGPAEKEDRFGIPVGPGETIAGTYSRKSGYTFALPASALLEYQGMLRNDHEMFWEIYPPMPPADSDIEGNKMLAVFSLVIQAPGNTPPEIQVHLEGRVKGNLWGVVPLRGSAVLP